MSDFVSQLRLKEMAEEDVYFARRDRELVEALRRRRRVGEAGPSAKSAPERPPKGAKETD